MTGTLRGQPFPAVRWTLSIGLSDWWSMMAAAHAQQEPETPPVERVIVTGFSIPTSEEIG